MFASYDHRKEKTTVFESMQSACYLSSASNVLALSLGMSTALEVVDGIPGAAATIVLASLVFGIVPYRNVQIVMEYERRWEKRGEKVRAAFDSLCSREIKRIHKQILDGISPYTRYVKSEEEGAIANYLEECEELLNSTSILRNRIIKLK